MQPQPPAPSVPSMGVAPVSEALPFGDRLAHAVRACGAPVCVGLDPHPGRLPAPLGGGADAARAFCVGVLDALHGRVPAVKPQVAFFERLGWQGVRALEEVIAHARGLGFVVVLDAKRGDIGSTAQAYAAATLTPSGADAVTLSPYLGPESMAPFVARLDALPRKRGAFVLVRTSNPGAGAWQDPEGVSALGMANQVAGWVEAQARVTAGRCGLGSVGAVVGATVPAEAARWRRAMPHAWLLVPGFGAQGGTTETVRALFRADGLGALVVSARAVLFPPKGREGADWQQRVASRGGALAQAFPLAAPRGAPTGAPLG